MYIPELEITITHNNVDDYLSLFAIVLDKLIDYKKELDEETDSDNELIEPVIKPCPSLLHPEDYQ